MVIRISMLPRLSVGSTKPIRLGQCGGGSPLGEVMFTIVTFWVMEDQTAADAYLAGQWDVNGEPTERHAFAFGKGYVKVCADLGWYKAQYTVYNGDLDIIAEGNIIEGTISNA